MANTKRLRQLVEQATKIESDFDFGSYCGKPKDKDSRYTGCLLSECIVVWPLEWHWHNEIVPNLVDNQFGWSPIRCAMQFFELTENEAYALFLPSMQWRLKSVKLIYCNEFAKRGVVIKNILTFCKYKENQKH